MENNPLLDISRISGRRGSKSTGRFLTRIKQMIQLKGKVRGGAMQDIDYLLVQLRIAKVNTKTPTTFFST